MGKRPWKTIVARLKRIGKAITADVNAVLYVDTESNEVLIVKEVNYSDDKLSVEVIFSDGASIEYDSEQDKDDMEDELDKYRLFEDSYTSF